MILIDYKSNFIRPDKKHDAEFERIRDEYKVQIELYREAVEKGTGREVSEAYLYLFAATEAISM
jgi:ATP-dependent helicase/nuclease subunit A